jgi:hypothetical protein
MWKENIAAENQAEAAQEKQLSKILSALLGVVIDMVQDPSKMGLDTSRCVA